MPVRHFLCRDYLHILFYIKFPVFVSLVHQIRIVKSVYLIATRDLSNLWLQFFLSQNQGFMRLFEKTVLK